MCFTNSSLGNNSKSLTSLTVSDWFASKIELTYAIVDPPHGNPFSTNCGIVSIGFS